MSRDQWRLEVNGDQFSCCGYDAQELLANAGRRFGCPSLIFMGEGFISRSYP